MGALELLTRILPENQIIVLSRFPSKNDIKDPTNDINDKYPDVEVIESPFKFSRKTLLDRSLEKLLGLLMVLLFQFMPKIAKKVFKNNKGVNAIIDSKFVLCNGGNLFYWNDHRKSLPRLLALIFPFIVAKKFNIKYGFLPQTMHRLCQKLYYFVTQGGLTFFTQVIEADMTITATFPYRLSIKDIGRRDMLNFPCSSVLAETPVGEATIYNHCIRDSANATCACGVDESQNDRALVISGVDPDFGFKIKPSSFGQVFIKFRHTQISSSSDEAQLAEPSAAVVGVAAAGDKKLSMSAPLSISRSDTLCISQPGGKAEKDLTCSGFHLSCMFFSAAILWP
jgi:hypothetical protein